MNNPLPDSLAIDSWLNLLRADIANRKPKLVGLFDIYANEAIFGRNFIAEDLNQLSQNASILEIGAGALILSCQLVREGYKVTALEPIGDGFSHFEELRSMVLALATQEGHAPKLISTPAEQLSEPAHFDFAFSINVMEHVADVAIVIDKVTNALRPNAAYHFICPNYLFPYEPHFNIPTLFSKRLTQFFFNRWILQSNAIPDPDGTWRSLNWITVTLLKSLQTRYPKLKMNFHKQVFINMIERAVSDPIFSARRSAWLVSLVQILVSLKIHKFAGWIPLVMQPVIDCKISKLL